MRIAIAGMHHESNTFSPIVTGKAEFLYYRGAEVFEKLENYPTVRGIVDVLAPKGHEILPASFIRAVPNGVVSRAFYEEFKADCLGRIAAFGALDGIVLSLHGSMSVEEIGDAEGDFLESLRAARPGIPVTSTLDMHATMTERMLRNVDGFAGYKTAPHVDMYETGVAAAKLMALTLETGKKLSMASRRVPILIAGEQTETSTEPTASLIALLRGAEASGEVLSASYLLGFPWADAETNGVTALAVTLGEPDKAEACVRRLATAFWERRKDFHFHTEAYPVEEALAKAFASGKRPVFVSDSGDNPTAGGAGDSTHFFSLLMASPERKAFAGKVGYAGFYDPESVARCRGKVGEELELDLGGKFDRANGAPVKVRARVLSYAAGWGPYASDLAAVRVENVDVVLAAKHIGCGDEIGYYAALGLDAADYPVLCLKLGYLTEIYWPYEPRSILSLSHGASDEILEALPFKKISRPVFPLDRDFDYAVL